MHASFLIPVVILLGLSTITSFLIKILNLRVLPVFAIQIFIGLLISRWFNQIVSDYSLGSFIEGINSFALMLLIFLGGYGMEFDIGKDIPIDEIVPGKHKKINILKVSLILTILSYVMGLLGALVFNSQITGDKVLGIVLLTLVFASTFAVIVVPILVEYKVLNSVLGKTLATVADISEGLSILFLSIFMIVINNKIEYGFIIALLLLALLVFKFFRMFNVGKFLGKFEEGIDHLITRFMIFVILGFVLLSDLAGGEYILGAFIAGIFLRQAKFPGKVVESIERFTYGLLAPMFFILAGTSIDIWSLIGNKEVMTLVLILIIVLLVVELPVLYLLKWYNLKTVIPSIVLMSCTIIVPIAARDFNKTLNLFSDDFAQALILASLIINVFGTIYFAFRFDSKRFKNNNEELINEK